MEDATAPPHPLAPGRALLVRAVAGLAAVIGLLSPALPADAGSGAGVAAGPALAAPAGSAPADSTETPPAPPRPPRPVGIAPT